MTILSKVGGSGVVRVRKKLRVSLEWLSCTSVDASRRRRYAKAATACYVEKILLGRCWTRVDVLSDLVVSIHCGLRIFGIVQQYGSCSHEAKIDKSSSIESEDTVN